MQQRGKYPMELRADLLVSSAIRSALFPQSGGPSQRFEEMQRQKP
jgi:hypothetical protein